MWVSRTHNGTLQGKKDYGYMWQYSLIIKMLYDLFQLLHLNTQSSMMMMTITSQALYCWAYFGYKHTLRFMVLTTGFTAFLLHTYQRGAAKAMAIEPMETRRQVSGNTVVRKSVPTMPFIT